MTLPLLIRAHRSDIEALVRRHRGEVDLVERTRYYRRECGDVLGERYFDAAVAALAAIRRMPGAGSSRVGELCGIRGLRVRHVAGFPCGWFRQLT